MRRALSRVFDGVATAGYALFGLLLVLIGLVSVGSLRPYGVLLGIIALVTGGGAILAAVQAWRGNQGTLSGPLLVVIGIVGLLLLAVIAFTGGRFAP